MKIKIIIIVIAIFCMAGCGKEKSKCTYYKSGKLKTKVIFNNIDTSSYIEYTYGENGKIGAIAEYKNYLLNGKVIMFYENGKIKSIQNLKNDTLNGERVTFYENGIKELSWLNINGKVNGVSTKYNRIGEIIKENLIINDTLIYSILYKQNKEKTKTLREFYQKGLGAPFEKIMYLYIENNKIVEDSSFYCSITGVDSLKINETSKFTIELIGFDVNAIMKTYIGSFTQNCILKDSVLIPDTDKFKHKVLYNWKAPNKVGFYTIMGKVYVYLGSRFITLPFFKTVKVLE